MPFAIWFYCDKFASNGKCSEVPWGRDDFHSPSEDPLIFRENCPQERVLFTRDVKENPSKNDAWKKGVPRNFQKGILTFVSIWINYNSRRYYEKTFPFLVFFFFFSVAVASAVPFLICDPQQDVTHYRMKVTTADSWSSLVNEIVPAQEDTTLRYDVEQFKPGKIYNFSITAIHDPEGMGKEVHGRNQSPPLSSTSPWVLGRRRVFVYHTNKQVVVDFEWTINERKRMKASIFVKEQNTCIEIRMSGKEFTVLREALLNRNRSIWVDGDKEVIFRVDVPEGWFSSIKRKENFWKKSARKLICSMEGRISLLMSGITVMKLIY